MSRKGMNIFAAADLYGLTDEPHSCGRSNVRTAELMLAAGIQVLQYREKDRTLREKYQECCQIRKLTQAAGALFLVNDHVDLALAVDADGVHIGQDDLPPAQVRKLVGPDRIVGLSTHSPVQAEAAWREGVVDYIGVGPLFPTRTKRNVCEPVGLEYLDYVVANIPLPFVAIGGVKEHNIGTVRAHGARLIAVVTDITSAGDVKAKITALRCAAAAR